MQTHNGGSTFRGPNVYAEAGLGTGGNQIVNAKTGSIPGGRNLTGDWHPTVLYLLLLLVVEWAAFIWITKYL